jgi:flagellar biosynthesis protein FlhB
MGLPLRTFLLLDGFGPLLWAVVPVALGYVFAAQVDTLLAALASAGKLALDLVLALIALYILDRWWRRRALFVALRMARITVEELHRETSEGRAPVVVDVARRRRAASTVESFPARWWWSSSASTMPCTASPSTGSS